MLDIAVIRERPDWVKEQIKKLNDPTALERIDKILELDQQRRSLLTEAEELQNFRNLVSKRVGHHRSDKSSDEATRVLRAQLILEAVLIANNRSTIAAERNWLQVALQRLNLPEERLVTRERVFPEITETDLEKLSAAIVTALKNTSDDYSKYQEQIAQVEQQLEENMLWLPNIPHASVPVFDSEEDNIPWKPEGDFFEFDFQPKPHWELGPALDIIEFERGVKLAGTRSYILKGMGARLQRALINFFLDMARDKGFIELYLPYMVQGEMMVGAGQFPKFRENVYYDPDADLYMLPTAEVAITSMHRDEILDEAQLPLYYVGHTPCFRRERMSAGRDVRGIKRVHQFEKVEMYKFTAPETSYDELETLTEAASDICRALKIPFRRLEIVTGDLGFSASKKYDIEMWSPGCEEWLEVSSCSNTEDFQARRANVRFRREGEKRPLYVHTLNGSGLATPRVLIAIMENYQQEDGSIQVPDVLVPYMGGIEVIGKA